MVLLPTNRYTHIHFGKYCIQYVSTCSVSHCVVYVSTFSVSHCVVYVSTCSVSHCVVYVLTFSVSQSTAQDTLGGIIITLPS